MKKRFLTSFLFLMLFQIVFLFSQPDDRFGRGNLLQNQQITNPGIVAYRDGEWLWSDHLFGLSKNVSINVEITKPADVKLPYTEGELRTMVADVFKKAGINPDAKAEIGKPELPMFHVLILVYPIRDGFALLLNGRLFESVTLNRVKLDDSVTMQAITWDKASIHVVSNSKFKEEFRSSVVELATVFAERYLFFQRLKNY